MKKKLYYYLIASLQLLNGLIFISNIYVVGNIQEVLAMHEDLSPNASESIIIAKVICTFIVGILYSVASIGLFTKRANLTLYGFVGTIIFIAFYFLELILWGGSHLMVWFGFTLAGGFSILFGIYDYLVWKNSKISLTI